MGGAAVLLTDLPCVLPLVEQNIAANAASIAAAGGSATVACLDWDSFERHRQQLSGFKFHAILAADCIYSASSISPLVRVLCNLLRQCCHRDSRVLWCHKSRHECVDSGLLG